MQQKALTYTYKAKLILTKMKNQNFNLCIMTQGLQIRYALLPVQNYNTDSNQN